MGSTVIVLFRTSHTSPCYGLKPGLAGKLILKRRERERERERESKKVAEKGGKDLLYPWGRGPPLNHQDWVGYL